MGFATRQPDESLQLARRRLALRRQSLPVPEIARAGGDFGFGQRSLRHGKVFGSGGEVEKARRRILADNLLFKEIA
jgi:hypothetical protein